MKNPLKKILKPLKTYMPNGFLQITNLQSCVHFICVMTCSLNNTEERFFSQFGEDIVLDNIFGHKKNGFYVDVGCYHPKHWSNTYLMHKKQWTGINIDIDEYKVQMFNMTRKSSINICTAVSNEEKEINYYCSRDYSPVNTLEQNFAEEMISKKPRVRL